MRVLLDTLFLIWAMYDDARLPEELVNILTGKNITVEYSIVSLWESEIKHNKHPEIFEFTSADLVHDSLLAGFTMLPLRPEHIYTVSSLEHDESIRHNDPFDRMLIAQAKSEGMLFVTHDKRLPAYDEPCIRYF